MKDNYVYEKVLNKRQWTIYEFPCIFGALIYSVGLLLVLIIKPPYVNNGVISTLLYVGIVPIALYIVGLVYRIMQYKKKQVKVMQLDELLLGLGMMVLSGIICAVLSCLIMVHIVIAGISDGFFFVCMMLFGGILNVTFSYLLFAGYRKRKI